jgi:hypothetical protein
MYIFLYYAMECQICYVADPKYEIQCSSKVPHKICYSCERECRLRAKPTSKGRICREPEKEPGCRSRTSYEAELSVLYKQLYKKEKLFWCTNTGICTSSARTTRQCSYPNGCDKHVCERCIMCVSHFA